VPLNGRKTKKVTSSQDDNRDCFSTTLMRVLRTAARSLGLGPATVPRCASVLVKEDLFDVSPVQIKHGKAVQHALWDVGIARKAVFVPDDMGVIVEFRGVAPRQGAVAAAAAEDTGGISFARGLGLIHRPGMGMTSVPIRGSGAGRKAAHHLCPQPCGARTILS